MVKADLRIVQVTILGKSGGVVYKTSDEGINTRDKRWNLAS